MTAPALAAPESLRALAYRCAETGTTLREVVEQAVDAMWAEMYPGYAAAPPHVHAAAWETADDHGFPTGAAAFAKMVDRVWALGAGAPAAAAAGAQP